MNKGLIKKELNILLLGRSGVGKSTFLNACANYFSYENLEDICKLKELSFYERAVKAYVNYWSKSPPPLPTEKLKTIIPSKIVLTDHKDNPLELKHGVELNADGNESMEDLQSGTGGCKAYSFEFIRTIVNFIDTPGIVDTQGVKKDEENVSNILDFLSQFESLHGICILLRPDEDRLDAILRYSILELLGLLDVSAAKNIIFVFTNCSPSQFRLKGSRKAVEMIIQEIQAKKPEIHVPFSNENYFLFDSEAYNFLIANKNGIEYNDLSIATFNNSWTESRSAWIKMIKHVQTLPVYTVQRSVSIYKARRLISILPKPLGEVVQNIGHYQDESEEGIGCIEMIKGDVNQLRGRLYVPSLDLELVPYDFPKIHCRSLKCRKAIVNDKGPRNTPYKKVCLEFKAETTWVDIHTVHLARIELGFKLLDYMLGFGNCSICNCKWQFHKVTYFGTREVDRGYEDEFVRERIDKTEGGVNKFQVILSRSERALTELDAELKCIQEARTKFTLFIKRKSLSPYNYAFKDYLMSLKKAAEVAPSGSRNEAFDWKLKLERYLQQHNENVQRFEESHSCEHDISPTEIEEIVKHLCDLKICGRFIKEAVDDLMTSPDNLRALSTVKVECEVPSFEID